MASSPDTPEPHRFWIVRFGWTVPLICGALVGVAFRLFFSGTPGEPYHAMMSTFTLLVPIVVGAVTVYTAERARRRSWSYYFFAAAAANALFVIGTMVVRVEGLICAVLAVPLFSLVGGLGGLLMGAICRWTKWPQRAVYSFAALPLLLGGLEQNLTLPQDTSRSKESARSPRAPRQFGHTSQSPKTSGQPRSALHGCIASACPYHYPRLRY
jgi:hypothetical protein